MLRQVKPIASKPSASANGKCQDCGGSGYDTNGSVNIWCWACDGSGLEPVYVVAGA